MLKEKLIEHLISEGKTDTWVNLYEKYPYKGHNLTNKQKGDAVRKLNKRLQRNSNMTQPKVNSLDELYYNIGYDGHFDEEVRLEDKRDGNYIIIADAHAPFINMKAWKSMISIIKDIKSTIAGIVYAGDFLDLNSLSFYDKGKMPLPGIDLSFEYKQSSKFFNLVERELPKHCYRAFLFGNHEDRALRHLKTPDGQRYGERLLSPVYNLDLQNRGYEILTNWVEDEVHIGDLTIIHGAFHNDHVAKKHLDVFKKNIAFGHVHRQQIYRTRNHKAYSIGCMLDINAPAFNYATKSMKETWSTGFAIASVFKGKTTLQLIQWDYDNECFFFGGKMYQ